MKRYLFTDEAKEDLADIRAYLKREAGPRIAKSTLNKIKDALIFLSHTPGAGHLREDLTNASVKFWPVFSYLIVYDPATRPLEIIRILHGSRDVLAILSQND
jgi:toxin ParE1/3/4